MVSCFFYSMTVDNFQVLVLDLSIFILFDFLHFRQILYFLLDSIYLIGSTYFS